MKLNVLKLVNSIRELPEKEKHNSNDLRMIYGLVSGSKFCFKKVTLDEIAYYINHLETILDEEYDPRIPQFRLQALNSAKYFSRRAI